MIATTLDTKSAEAACMREALAGVGLGTILIDCGILGEPALKADISASQVAALAGNELESLRQAGDRGLAVETMMRGVASCMETLVREKLVLGFLAMGGGTNTALAAAVFERLPYGLPKLLVATTVSGDVSRIIGAKDVVLIHSVVDILGTGSYLRGLFERTAAVMKALVDSTQSSRFDATRLPVGVTAFGSTTPAANRVFERLSAAGHDVLTFHARGSGGRAAEAFMRDGAIRLMLDLTTTEIADEVVGGTMSAGPTRLDAAVDMGLPQVLLPGAIDMVNFGPLETVPSAFAGRNLLQHTPMTTLMRTSPIETAEIARYMARKLNRATAPVAFVVPMHGFSSYDIAGGAFFDPAANAAFIEALDASLRPDIPVLKVDAHINDVVVADLAVDKLLQMAAAPS